MTSHGSNGRQYENYPEQFYPSPVAGRLPGSTDVLRREPSFEVQIPLFNRQAHSQNPPSTPVAHPHTPYRHAPQTPTTPLQRIQSQNKDDRPGLMCALAETYFSRARTMGTAAYMQEGGEAAEEYCKLVSTGLGLLESALINSQPPKQIWKLQPKMEASIRLRYAHMLYEETENTPLAEDVLNKGILLAGRNKLHDLKFAMQYLLVRIIYKVNARAALSILLNAVTDAEQIEAHHWIYSFKFLRCFLLSERTGMRDLFGASGSLRSVSAHAFRRQDYQIFIYANLLDAVLALFSGAKNSENIKQALDKAAAAAIQPEYPRQLALFSASLNIVAAVMQGNTPLAQQKLGELHELLQSKAAESWSNDFTLLVNPSREGRPFETLKFYWISRMDTMVLGYFLSGLVLYQDNATTNEKAERFFDEALKKLNRLINSPEPVSVSGAARNLQWRKSLRYVIIVCKCFLLCGRSQWDEAKVLLSQAEQCFSDLEPTPAPNYLHDLLSYLKGTLAQATGSLQHALEHYRESYNIHTELGLISGINACIILRGSEINDPETAEDMLNNMETHVHETKNRHLIAAYSCARASGSTELLQAKKLLSQTLDFAKSTSNHQIVYITLAFMCHRFFANIVSEQAEKAAKAAFMNAQRNQDSLWQSVAGQVLSDCLARKGDSEGAYRVKCEIYPHQQAVSANLSQGQQEEGNHMQTTGQEEYGTAYGADGYGYQR